ncbi:MAG: hypothetical protein K2N98_06060, partial [Lachnospiraceae bacterium]|nr:hypothetical protein [Lachnospiraceae bacterium]
CTGSEASDSFKTEFIDWLKKHDEDLQRLEKDTGPKKGIFIRKQINKGNAQVSHIVNQYNYGENGNRK